MFSAWKFLNYSKVGVEFETNSGIICSKFCLLLGVGLARGGRGQIFDMCTQKGLTPHTPVHQPHPSLHHRMRKGSCSALGWRRCCHHRRPRWRCCAAADGAGKRCSGTFIACARVAVGAGVRLPVLVPHAFVNPACRLCSAAAAPALLPLAAPWNPPPHWFPQQHGQRNPPTALHRQRAPMAAASFIRLRTAP